MNLLNFFDAENAANMGYGKKRKHGYYQYPKRQKTPTKVIVKYKKSELKYFEGSFNGIVDSSTDWVGTELDINSPSSLGTLFAPIQGVDINDRVGRSVQVYSIKIRGTISLDTNPDDLPATLVRLILVRDKETKKLAFNAGDVMQPPTVAVAQMVQTSFRNLSSLGRYKIYKDKTYSFKTPVPVDSGNGGIPPDIPFKMSVRFKKPVTVNFTNTNTGTFADITDNSFHLFGHANETSPALYYTVRIGFRDP